jgi:hypothetical protein
MSNLLTNPLIQIFDNGVPLEGGLIFFYNSGTLVKATIYQNNAGTNAPNPVTLNADGVPVSGGGTPIPIYFPHGQAIKMVVAPAGASDPPSSTLYTFDPIIGDPDIDYGTYFTATSATQITTQAGITLRIANSGTLDCGTATVKIATISDIVSSLGVLAINGVPSAVNKVSVTNAATGNDPSLAALGGDTNVSIALTGQGTGAVKLGQATSTDVRLVADQPIADSSGNEYISFTKTASAVNQLNITNAATGNAPILSPAGNDSTIPLRVDTKGASTLNLGTTNATSIQLGNISSPITANAAINNSNVTIASAATVNIGAAASNVIDISGTTTITAFDSITAGALRYIRFTGALTLTHNATSLILPGAGNITTTSGDAAILKSLGSGNWQCINYMPIKSVPNMILIQRLSTQTGAVATGTTLIPNTDTIPQNTQGDQYMTLSITPKNTNNILVISVIAFLSNSGGGTACVALFQDSTANAIAAGDNIFAFNTQLQQTIIRHIMAAGTTSSTTFKVRCGSALAGTTTFNGAGGVRRYGGVLPSSIMIEEYSL